MATKIWCCLALMLLIGTAESLPAATPKGEFIEAPYKLDLLKMRVSKKRFRDITTTGQFLVYRVDLYNLDTVGHTIDYACFCVTDSNGTVYEVHLDATLIKQGERVDWSPLKDADTWGFSHMTLKPMFRLNGWLIFEVPNPGAYQLNFRGYLK